MRQNGKSGLIPDRNGSRLSGMARLYRHEMTQIETDSATERYFEQTGKIAPVSYRAVELINLNEWTEPREYARVIATLLNGMNGQGRIAAINAAREFAYDPDDSGRYRMGINYETYETLRVFANAAMVGFNINLTENGWMHQFTRRDHELVERAGITTGHKQVWRRWQGIRRRVILIDTVLDHYRHTGFVPRRNETDALRYLRRDRILNEFRIGLEEIIPVMGRSIKTFINHLLDHPRALADERIETTLMMLTMAETQPEWGSTVLAQTRKRRPLVWKRFRHGESVPEVESNTEEMWKHAYFGIKAERDRLLEQSGTSPALHRALERQRIKRPELFGFPTN